MTATVAKPQGSRKVKLKEADSKLSTVGTRTGSEAYLRATSWLGTAKSNSHQDARGQILHLTSSPWREGDSPA